jgi:hypothetical protein
VNPAAFVRLVAIGIALSVGMASVCIAIGKTSAGVMTSQFPSIAQRVNDFAAKPGALSGASINPAITVESATSEVAGASVRPTGSPISLTPVSATHLNIRDFCVPVSLDGTTDNTACIQAAVTAICAHLNGMTGSPINGGGMIDLPPNAYTINANVGVIIPCEGVIIQGSGWGDPSASSSGTEIKIIGTGSRPIFDFTGAVKGNAGRYSYGGGVREIGFVTGNATTSITQTGPMVAFNYCWHCHIDRVHSSGAFKFATNYAGLGNDISHSVITQVMPGGEAIEIYGSDHCCPVR